MRTLQKKELVSLEAYLNFVGPEDIRIRGTRIGIETVVYAYQEGLSPEEMMQAYPSLSLEQVYAVITYYLRNQAQVNDYITRLEKWSEARQLERDRNPPPVVQRLRALRAQIRREEAIPA
jgi:uncharacterized protein (DUF433 family)